MSMNPFFNALVAALYIVLIVLVMNTLMSFAPPKDTILAPMTALSLFVLSAAVMGFLFVYKPFQLYFDDRKQEAVLFFAKTVGGFSCFVLALVVILLLWTPR